MNIMTINSEIIKEEKEEIIWMPEKDVRWLSGRPVSVSDFMKDRMHEMLNRTIFDYIANRHTFYEGDSHIRSMLLDHPIVDVLLHPHSGFIVVGSRSGPTLRRKMYEKYCNKQSDTQFAHKMLENQYNIRYSTKPEITFDNVKHIKLGHDISEYSFEYVMYVKPELTDYNKNKRKEKEFYEKL